jgi:hypothetical protein
MNAASRSQRPKSSGDESRSARSFGHAVVRGMTVEPTRSKLESVRVPTNVVIAVVAACASLGCRSKSQLAAIAKPQLSLSLLSTAKVMVVPSEAPFDKDDCPLLAPETRATLNDVPLVRQRGIHTGDDFAYNRDCILELSIPVGSIPRTQHGARLRIWDDATSWLFEVPTAFAPRSFELAYPTQAVSRRGAEVTLVWSTPSDDLDPTWIAFELMRADGEPGSGTTIRNPEIDGKFIRFTIPLAEGQAAWSGPALLRFLGTPGVEPAQEQCPVDACSVELDFKVPSLPIQVAEPRLGTATAL